MYVYMYIAQCIVLDIFLSKCVVSLSIQYETLGKDICSVGEETGQVNSHLNTNSLTKGKCRKERVSRPETIFVEFCFLKKNLSHNCFIRQSQTI